MTLTCVIIQKINIFTKVVDIHILLFIYFINILLNKFKK